MKILHVRLMNLNSLRGRVALDFEQGPLASAGLFAITGPTGAGKSTLLDAITLALFGRVARYGGSNPIDMMSRHTGECFAEVDFACAAGRFRSSWSVQRAHRKPGGAVQTPKRRLIALPGEEVLTDKHNEATKLVEDHTGLDYERFLRSVMLAQGDFSAFLRAKADERASLLEKLTGTGIYREISRLAYVRCEERRVEVDRLSQQGAGVVLLTDEERAAREAELLALRAQAADLTTQAKQLRERLADAETLAGLRADLQQCEQAAQALAVEREAAAGRLLVLALAEKAALLAPKLATLDRERAELARVETTLAALASEGPVLQQAVAQLSGEQSAAAATLAEESARDAALQTLLLEVQALDATLASGSREVDAVRLKQRSAEAERATLHSQRSQAEAQRDEVGRRLAKGREWLSSNASHAGIAEQLPAASALAASHEGVASKLAFFTREVARLSAENAEQLKAELALGEEQRRQAAQLAEAFRGEQEAVRDFDNAGGLAALERLVTEAAADSAAEPLLERALALSVDLAAREAEQAKLAADLASGRVSVDQAGTRVQELTATLIVAEESLANARRALGFAERCSALEAQRAQLEEGKECPLCGSLHHPWHHGALSDAAELVQARAALQAAEQVQRNSQASLRDATLARERADAALRRCNERIDETRAAAGRLASELAELGSRLSALSTLQRGAPFAVSLAAVRERLAASGERRASLQRLQAAAQGARDVLQRITQAGELLAAKAARQAQQVAKSAADLAAAQREQASCDEQSAALHSQFAALLASLGLPEFSSAPVDDHAKVLGRLQDLARVHAASLAKFQALEADSAKVAADLALLAEASARNEATLVALSTELQARETGLLEQRTRRTALIGEVTVEAARSASLRKVEAAVAREAAVSRRLQEARLRHEAARTQGEALASEHLARQENARLQAFQLEQALASAGFADETALRSALLADAALAELRGFSQALAQRASVLEADRARLTARIASLEARNTGVNADLESLPALRLELGELETLLEKCQSAQGSALTVLANDDAQRARAGSLREQLAAARREHARWDRLRALIGAADGASFAKFAQGLTLDHLTVLANRQLHHLNPRFSIRRVADDTGMQLELEIVDHYQADVTRPMGSLSGGESFLASLALSLGLSELVSGRRAIDSLFIDEGFGTLDADTLDQAMSALEALRTRGKTVGVISHVAAMQERIATQIRVTKQAGGVSIVELVAG